MEKSGELAAGTTPPSNESRRGLRGTAFLLRAIFVCLLAGSSPGQPVWAHGTFLSPHKRRAFPQKDGQTEAWPSQSSKLPAIAGCYFGTEIRISAV